MPNDPDPQRLQAMLRKREKLVGQIDRLRRSPGQASDVARSAKERELTLLDTEIKRVQARMKPGE